MADSRDYYSILQVNKRASADEIERSYERLAKLYDPDVSRKRRASERWEQIKQAYDTLSDPAKRAEYDKAGTPTRIRETAVTRFLASRWGLPSIAALVGSIVIVAVIVGVVTSGGGNDDAVADITTPVPITPSPTPIPTPSPVTTIPPLTDEGITTESGLQVITIEEGTGDSPVIGDDVLVHYTGWVEATGAKFDSSVDRGTPTNFTLSVGGLIDGWIEGIPLMNEGGKARLIIPGDLGYKEAGNPAANIPPNATLIFDIELIDVVKEGETPMPTSAPTPSPTAEATDDPTASPEPTS